ncbi:hypothetical protein D9611_005055 [Ephemerocybe angulata]|uniref:F-box domain-containing protein n=1 Tax=Ephemerocybe angulata TaxID=980116 RepID=A0A8H5EX47_9AGAR|nr:hypothetical protein D9611_005055 [Tulosesus angulatus]
MADVQVALPIPIPTPSPPSLEPDIDARNDVIFVEPTVQEASQSPITVVPPPVEPDNAVRTVAERPSATPSDESAVPEQGTDDAPPAPEDLPRDQEPVVVIEEDATGAQLAEATTASDDNTATTTTEAPPDAVTTETTETLGEWGHDGVWTPLWAPDTTGATDWDPPARVEHVDMDLPFSAEEDIDVGSPFTGLYVMYEPAPLMLFPFDGMEDSELQNVIKGNFASFFQQRCGHEFYRNYVRGNTIRKLRTAPDTIRKLACNLNGIFELPTELLYDVLELAHPIDLLHLSRSNKAFRKLILSKRSEHVWKSAYDNYSELHPPPDQVSPPKWTAMMFDDARCDFCGNPGALLDFAMEEHYCDSCIPKYLVEQHDMHSYITENYPPRILDYLYQLLPATYRQAGGKYQTYYESENNAKYRKKEVMAMIETLQTWYMTIDEGMIPDAGEKFKLWRKALAKKIMGINEYAQYFNNWATTFYYNLCTEISQAQRELADACMKKFIKFGFDERDTDAASSDVYYYFRSVEISRMTPKLLEKHKAELITKIEGHKRERMKRERRTVVDQFYLDYKRTLKPEEWAFLPPSDVVAYDDHFSEFINQDTLDKGEDLKLEPAKERLPTLISDWLFNRQKELYENLPGVTMPPEEVEFTEAELEGLSQEEIEKKTEEVRKDKKVALKVAMDERMKRATAVFSCTSCKAGRHSGLAVIGWDSACVHMCGSYSHYFHMGWEFCSVGYAAAASLVRQLGLDPDTATPEEVDALDARFFCGNCPVKTHKKVQGRKAYTWRECVMHAVEKEEDHTHAIPAWMLMSKEATSFVRAHEIPYPCPQRLNWSCNHCSEHVEAGLALKAAKAHVKEAHSIENPVVDVDVIYMKNRYERKHYGRRRPIFHYGIEPTCNLHCKLCREGKVQRMWTIQALVPHLFHMHGISMPQSKRDYTKIEIMAT